MNRRRVTHRIAAPVAAVALLLAACGGSRDATSPSIVSKSFESTLHPGGGAGATTLARSTLDLADAEWVTAFRTESSAGAPAWHSDLRLRNGTRLVSTGPGHAAVEFPPGFGVPLGQILRDTPEAWRGAAVVSSVAPAEAAAGAVRIKSTIDYVAASAAEGGTRTMRRLYVLSLPLVDEDASDAGPGSVREGDPVAEPRARRAVPPGNHAWKAEFSYVVPVDCTVHYAAAHLEGPVRSIRLTDITDGKVLWEADVEGEGVRPYSSETGFPLYREHSYRIEAALENPGTAPASGAVVHYLYYRPPGNETFGYPLPPEGQEEPR
jgi:hypothetical protein